MKGSATAVAATSLGSLAPLARAGAEDRSEKKVRVAAVFLSNPNGREVWPYPKFDAAGRQQEVLARLAEGCPEVEFLPVDARKAVAMRDSVDGYLVYAVMHGSSRQAMHAIAKLGKPTVLADEFLGGGAVFLGSYSGLRAAGTPVAGVSSARLDDLVTVARQFATVREPGATPASFAQRCEEAYRKTFPPNGETKCRDDSLKPADIGECLKRLRDSRFLIVNRGSGQERDFFGAKGIYLGFEELGEFYKQADPDEAAEWAGRWSKRATPLADGDYVEPSVPQSGVLDKCGAIYLATLELLKKYGTDTVTMNCLGGFNAGKLPAYPCLGFMELLDDGRQGVCEAQPDDTLSMLMARILTGRPGFVSDPALDTSKNQIVYAHCVGTTKVFGPEGEANGFRIRTLHNRDPRGACAESMMPAGYMTTSFRTNVARKQMIIHQAKSLGPLDHEYGCRTKLVGEVDGDIEKLFHHWHAFGWHRVTVYGDVLEPLTEFGRALGLKVIKEA